MLLFATQNKNNAGTPMNTDDSAKADPTTDSGPLSLSSSTPFGTVSSACSSSSTDCLPLGGRKRSSIYYCSAPPDLIHRKQHSSAAAAAAPTKPKDDENTSRDFDDDSEFSEFFEPDPCGIISLFSERTLSYVVRSAPGRELVEAILQDLERLTQQAPNTAISLVKEYQRLFVEKFAGPFTQEAIGELFSTRLRPRQ